MKQESIICRHINTAVAIVVFNRIDCVMELMDAIRQATPPRLYIISDGPREGKKGEKEKVLAVRDYIEQFVDWDCTLVKVYAETNMGCDPRVVSGLNYVFQHEESAIIFEDDCIPLPEFFSFCDCMLEKYADSEEIMMVAGMTANQKEPSDILTYYFTHFALKLGWATWKRAWNLFDEKMITYKNFSNKYLYEIMPESAASYFKGNFLSNYNGRLTWDSKWDYSVISNRAFAIVPAISMINNIGFERIDSTHAGGKNPFEKVTSEMVPKGITLQDNIVWSEDYDKKQLQRLFNGSVHGNNKFYYREKALYFAKKYFPRWLYKTISFVKRKIKK